jgi:hypothetical protein
VYCRVLRWWLIRSPMVSSNCQNCGVVSTDSVLRCFVNPEGLNCEDLLEGAIPELGELANGLRLNTEVLS